VPVAGEVVLAWGEPKVGTDGTVLEGQSFAILRRTS
jgi:maltooligosyltrehalose trehalohydrolase